MDISMKINSEKVRELRNNKGWSQEQLSVSSGLSLRTIQRIESEGKTSRESKVCLAATFDIDLNAIALPNPKMPKNINDPTIPKSVTIPLKAV